MEIVTSPTREKFPLSLKKIIKKTITNVISWSFLFGFIFLMVGGGALASLLDNSQDPTMAFGVLGFALFGFVTLMAIIGVLTYFYQRWYFAVYYYDIQNDYLVIKKGPIAPREITIPWERIQDVYVDQDIFDRLLGLYDVHLSTATIASGMQAHIDGVEQQAADGLREALLEKVRSRISRK